LNWSDSVDVRTAAIIKAHTGLNILPWFTAIREGDPAACQAFLWALKRQNGENPAEPSSLVDFNVTDLVTAYVKSLLAELSKKDDKPAADPTASPSGSTPSSTETSESSETSTSSS
jgi:hypothetical protein